MYLLVYKDRKRAGSKFQKPRDQALEGLSTASEDRSIESKSFSVFLFRF